MPTHFWKADELWGLGLVLRVCAPSLRSPEGAPHVGPAPVQPSIVWHWKLNKVFLFLILRIF